jgi:hypothetical protein
MSDYRNTGAPAPRITPAVTPENPNPWDIADGHANVAEQMGSPLGVDNPDVHTMHIGNHDVAKYASYIDEEVRNPEGAS